MVQKKVIQFFCLFLFFLFFYTKQQVVQHRITKLGTVHNGGESLFFVFFLCKKTDSLPSDGQEIVIRQCPKCFVKQLLRDRLEEKTGNN